MNLADRLHKAADGTWWYAPLTLAAYWAVGVLCSWFVIDAITQGQMSGGFRRSFRLLSTDGNSISFAHQPMMFSFLSLCFCGLAIYLFVTGWLKFSVRRRTYLYHAKQF